MISPISMMKTTGWPHLSTTRPFYTIPWDATLATGRPGLFLWLTDDPRGASGWQALDLLVHHNAVLGSEHRIRPGKGGQDPEDPYQTTAYAVLVETAPNRLLLAYDRIPFGWRGVPTDSAERNRIYVLDVEVERQ